MKKLIPLLLAGLLTGCASIAWTDEVNSVVIGDTYVTVINKMRYYPTRVRCLTISRGEICTATYRMSDSWTVYYKFNNDILVSIYK